jgi:hypothetical protein
MLGAGAVCPLNPSDLKFRISFYVTGVTLDVYRYVPRSTNSWRVEISETYFRTSVLSNQNFTGFPASYFQPVSHLYR